MNRPIYRYRVDYIFRDVYERNGIDSVKPYKCFGRGLWIGARDDEEAWSTARLHARGDYIESVKRMRLGGHDVTLDGADRS